MEMFWEYTDSLIKNNGSDDMKNLLLTLALLLSTASASAKKAQSYLMGLSSADRTVIENK